MPVLVVGGAGYIGAHVVRSLLEGGDDVVVADDLSTGHLPRVAGVEVVKVDIAEPDATASLRGVMVDRHVDAVVHLAAKKSVGASVAQPTYYYRQNVSGLAHLLDAMESAGVGRLVFSSSAAVYGSPREAAHGAVAETVQPRPISPYGETKLVGEWICHDAHQAWGLQWCGLRYFNVVGAGSPLLGDTGTHNLVPLVFQALDRGEPALIFGDDYPTPDGTCVRDYVHVRDVAEAHHAALRWLAREHDLTTPPVFNIGTGAGTSVREVLRAISSVTGREVRERVVDRRPGDPASLVADVRRVTNQVGWRSRWTVEDAIGSAWAAWQLPRPRST